MSVNVCVCEKMAVKLLTNKQKTKQKDFQVKLASVRPTLGWHCNAIDFQHCTVISSSLSQQTCKERVQRKIQSFAVSGQILKAKKSPRRSPKKSESQSGLMINL